MATAQNVFVTPPRRGHLRPFDAGKDMRPVADLVEMCFSSSIDPDGRRYLNQMRSAANNPGLLNWAVQIIEPASMPLAGFVFEEDDVIVGNLSLITFSMSGRRLYLIANVAVHPRFRRRGIARELTHAALEHARKRQAAAVWLHVREDNEAALKLYRSMGFQEKGRRTTWHNRFGKNCKIENNGKNFELPSGYQIGPRWNEHWEEQNYWLQRMYPPELSWHFPLNLRSYRPSIWGNIKKLFSGNGCSHWSVQKDGRLYGVLTRQTSSNFADNLWLAVPEEYDNNAIHALLIYAQKKTSSKRPLTLDIPARLADDVICKAGFNPHQTLIWMKIPFE
jgi:ribosomal protein S18 acetylase RimI-like enzyme